jgi:glycosyltransferase involved in cell wall biosynthesis
VTVPSLSVVIPVYNEGEAVRPTLDRVLGEIGPDSEVLVVYDMPEDTTRPVLEEYAATDKRVRPSLNTIGRGPANAIRFGLGAAAASVAIVTMADDSDDASQIEELAQSVRDGAVVAAASRYMKGGEQKGGPFVKRTLSRLAGLSLFYLARVGTHDATNSFKAYSTQFVRRVGVESDRGFEIGIELTAKARRARLPIVEIPTTWKDRPLGESNFQTTKWIPYYLRWWFHAFGPARPMPQLTQEES